jgi:hypothetical protein
VEVFMTTRWLLGALVFGFGLACGGGGGGGAVGAYAESYAEYAETEYPGIECGAYAVGREVTVGDFTFVFDQPLLVQGEDSLPWIQNHEERKVFAREGTKALVIPYQVRNDSPVKKKRDVWFPVVGSDGESAPGGSYNAHLYEAEHALEDYGSSLPPGRFLPMVSVNSIQPGGADGAVAHLKQWGREQDIRGKRHDVVLAQAVVDLGTPTEGPHINPEKR